MRNKPLLILLITFGLILVPVVYLSRLWLFQNINPLHMSPLGIILFLFISIVSLTVAFGVWRVRRWGFYALVIFGVMTAVLDLYTWKTEDYALNGWFLLDMLAAFAGLFLIVQEEVRKPYFNPHIRWWETAKRIQVDVAATVHANGRKEDILILDVSITGCFTEVFDTPLSVGQLVRIVIYHDLLQFESEAIVVRKSENPDGYGLMFKDMNRENKTIMNKILKNLKKG